MSDAASQASQQDSEDSNFVDANNVPFALNPAQATGSDLLDFAKKLHKSHYLAATKSLYADTTERFDLSEVKLHDFLSTLKRRAENCSFSTVEVPNDINHVAGPSKSIVTNHGELTLKHVKDFCETFIGTETRAAQDDYMLFNSLVNSLSVDAYGELDNMEEEYTIRGTQCGAMFLMIIIRESAADATIDPDTIRKEISQAPRKFKELKYSVKELNAWINLKLRQLRANGETSDDLRTHLMSAYRSSDDKEFCTYINSLKDLIRDSRASYTPKQIMSMAKLKEEELKHDREYADLDTIPKDEQILALEARMDKLSNKFANKRKQPGKGKGNGNGKGTGKGKGDKGNKKPFPKELRNAGPPADHTKPKVIDKVEYWYCKVHKKWGMHPTHDCKKKQALETSGTTNANSSGGDRMQRTARAVTAIMSNHSDSDSE